MKIVLSLLFLIVFNLASAGEVSSELANECGETAEVFLLEGELNQTRVGARTWDFGKLKSTISAELDPNNCMGAVIEQAVADLREYWLERWNRYLCYDNSSPHYDTTKCRNSDNWSDPAGNLAFLDSFEIKYLETEGNLQFIRLCQGDLTILDEEFEDQIRAIEVHTMSQMADWSRSWEAEDTYAGNACVKEMTCMDKIHISKISSRLAAMEAVGQPIDEATITAIFDEETANLGPTAKQKIFRAMMDHALRETAPPQDMEVLSYMKRGNDFLSEGDPSVLQEYQDAVQNFRDFLNDTQKKSDYSFPYRASTFLSWGVQSTVGIKTTLEEEANKYIIAVENLMSKLDDYLITDTRIPKAKRDIIREQFQGKIKETGEYLIRELEDTEYSIMSAEAELKAPFYVIAAVGLGVATGGLTMGGTAFGFFGASSGMTGAAALLSTAGTLAVEGAGFAAVGNMLRRGVDLYSMGEHGGSVYCQAIEHELKNGRWNFLAEIGIGATAGAVMGTGIGQVMARAKNWGTLAKVGGIAVGGTAIAGLGVYSVGSTYSNSSKKIAALDTLINHAVTEDQKACFQAAKTTARNNAHFDVALFAAEVLGPAAIEGALRRLIPNLAESAAKVSDDVPVAPLPSRKSWGEWLSSKLVRERRGTMAELPTGLNARSGLGNDVAAARYGTTPDETISLRGYAQGRYKEINEALRRAFRNDAEISPGTQGMIDSTTAGLEKLSQVPGRSYRGTNLPDSEVSLLREAFESGKGYVDPAFLSSSSDRSTADFFTYPNSPDRPVIYTIDGQSGRQFDEFSAFNREGEILFPPKTEFVVKGFDDSGENILVHLVEVPTAPRQISIPENTPGEMSLRDVHGFFKDTGVFPKDADKFAELAASHHSRVQPTPDGGIQVLGNDGVWRSITPQQLLGEGATAVVYNMGDGTVMKVARNPNGVAKLALEVDIASDLVARNAEYGIDVIPAQGYTRGDPYLMRPLLEADQMGTHLATGNMSKNQKTKLKELWESAARYARDTGIGLDLKADNLYWDSTKGAWAIFDTGPRMVYQPYGFTADVLNFDAYLRTWSGSDPGVPQRYSLGDIGPNQ